MSTHDTSTAIIANSESATIACPFSDRRPVPCGSTADGPLGFGKHAPLSPHVDGVALHAEAFGDLDEAHGLAVVHEDHCTESLDICPLCIDNQYMTTTSSPRPVCPNCHGHGDLIGQGGATGRSTCWTCGGTGKVNPPPRPITAPMHNHRTMRPAPRGKCPACDARRDSDARSEQTGHEGQS